VSPARGEVGIGELAHGFKGHRFDYTVDIMAEWRAQRLE
jgi:hypothetical protein